MVEQGREYNPETAMDLRPRAFQFLAHGEEFRFRLEIPEYVLARINRSEVSNRLQEYMEGYAATVVLAAIRGGYLHNPESRQRMASDVGAHLRNYIWERFSITQEQHGQECWQVAPSLQEVRR